MFTPKLSLLCLALVLLTSCVAEEGDPRPAANNGDSAPATTSRNESDSIESDSNQTSMEPIPMYSVKLETSAGDITIEVNPEWAPIGAAHFKELVEAGYYDGCRFFRVVDGFMAQCGMNGDPKVLAQWRNKTLQDEPAKQSNTRGMVTYAKTGAPNSRSVQFFVNYGDNSFLDGQGFAPFGKVSEGMDVVDSFCKKYGEQPDQGMIGNQGNEYLNAKFPDLTYIKTATIVE